MRDTLPEAGRSKVMTARALIHGAFLAATAAAVATPVFAQSGERWQPHQTEAQATVPTPRASGPVTGLTLSCAAQRWVLMFEMEGDTVLKEATLTVDRKPYRLAPFEGMDRNALRLPRLALDPLKTAVRAELALDGEGETASTRFALSLRGSHRAITTLEERCTPRDMSAYDTVTLTPYSSYLELARSLREGDIAAFELATASKPQLTAAMAEFGAGRRVLFTRLCGSSWYFGRSGCNLTGFAFDASADRKPDDTYETQWRVVYDTENARIHTDPKAGQDGWHDLVTLPVAGGGEGSVWRWNGKRYVRHATLADEDETLSGSSLELRPTRD
ncbi:hypothetical protein [Aerobium aerolatum]|uniref:Uncharacterized protein n=1 Tax=Aquamicrobium aerolatum DSM 21857 TaxID=1121003 RepID=A0A1I3IUI8_9HYPH|nr:hypothetical protein [Aquamicrobium aerolatum]SFI51618.1 hypothetical protein SAMN03080618_00659 [Aquamicrobium aerolatum DSM 21857]